MITLILLPIFLLFTYLFYMKTMSNIAEDKSILKDANLYLLGMIVIFLFTIIFPFI